MQSEPLVYHILKSGDVRSSLWKLVAHFTVPDQRATYVETTCRADVSFKSKITANVFCVARKLADVSPVCPLQHSVASGYVAAVSMTTTGHWKTVPYKCNCVIIVVHVISTTRCKTTKTGNWIQ